MNHMDHDWNQEEEERKERKNKLSSRMMTSFMVTALVVLPFVGMKMMINKQYEAKQGIIRHVSVDYRFPLEGVTYVLDKEKWLYLGMASTNIRPETHSGGYMVNLLGIQKVKGQYFVTTVTVDDRARETYHGKYDIDLEKGSCQTITSIGADQVALLIENRSAGYYSEPFMGSKSCKTYENAFTNTDWNWSWGSLHMSRGAQEAMEQ